MKTEKGREVKGRDSKVNTKFNANKHRPDIRDNLDSREGEEQQFKGDDVTHNRKDEQTKKTGKKPNT